QQFLKERLKFNYFSLFLSSLFIACIPLCYCVIRVYSVLIIITTQKPQIKTIEKHNQTHIYP
ncbi:hypothetical protein ACQKBN_07945, partial [Helicobacter pylori]